MPNAPLIDYNSLFEHKPKLRWLRPAMPLIARLFKWDELNERYEQFFEAFNNGTTGDTRFFTAALRFFGVNFEVSESDLEKIPETGALMVLSNHPFGAVDGLTMGAILTHVRPDARLLVNEMLQRITPISPYVFGVDIFGGKSATRKNFKSMKQALNWLKSDGCMGTFPSGIISHFSFSNFRVVDPPWNESLTELVQRSGAEVLPMFFEGRNSLLFQIAGLIHPVLRTMMVAREMLRMNGKTLKVRIGTPISAQKLASFETVAEATQFLRLKSYVLRERMPDNTEVKSKVHRFPLALPKPKTKRESVIAPVATDRLAAEVATLPASSCLHQHGDLQVWNARADEIPNVLQEIGRLRELTFREIGEGTGKSIDLDEFDSYYLHLFIWNPETHEVVGAYRMGLTDEIMPEHGKKGLYTATLFKLKDELLETLNPAIELGRSFVRVEYQRKHATLSLLWKGIGSFIGQHPKYARLFGPVSITAEYSSISKDLMVQFLRNNRLHPSFSKLVKARKPHRFKRLRMLMRESMQGGARSIDDVSALISEIEADQKGVPILLKHYLKLNGVMLSFNRDPKFSNSLDGLILVDLEQTDPVILRKHMGNEAWERFSRFHAPADKVAKETRI